MRIPALALLAATLGGTVACSGASDPTGPGVAGSRVAVLARGRTDPVDFSGYWVPFFSYIGWLDDPVSPAGSGIYDCFGGSFPEVSVLLRLSQDGTRVVGTPPHPLSAFVCEWTFGRGWVIDIDDTFEGRVHGDEIRFSLNRHMDIRATMDPDGFGMTGTVRVRIEPPFGNGFWVEQPIHLGFWRSL